MRRAEVQSSRRNSYGASIPLMEGVRGVVGEVSVVTRTTLTGPCKPRRGRAPGFTRSDRHGLCACAERERAGEGLRVLPGVIGTVYVHALRENAQGKGSGFYQE